MEEETQEREEESDNRDKRSTEEAIIVAGLICSRINGRG